MAQERDCFHPLCTKWRDQDALASLNHSLEMSAPMHKKLSPKTCSFFLLASFSFTAGNAFCQPSPIFLEAENFQLQGDGWQVAKNSQTRRASLAVALNGSNGKADSTATQTVTIPNAGKWRIWVRYMVNNNIRNGAFDVDVTQGDQVTATKTFDLTPTPSVDAWDYHWDFLDVDLAAGAHQLRLRKHQNKNASGLVRNVDSFLLTQDLAYKPNHLEFGPQVWMRVTLGEGYEKPTYVHIFADHFRDPWYAHYALSKDGAEKGLSPKRREAFLKNGESTAWSNITETVYQDSGAILHVQPAYSYTERAPRFKGVVEFANRPQDDAIIRKIELDDSPSLTAIVVPPNFENAENVAKIKTDLDLANQFGAIADSMKWPTIGKKPVKFPFFVASSLNPENISKTVVERELKTLSYFNFNGMGSSSFYEPYGYTHKYIGGVGWHTKGSYSAPDVDRITKQATSTYESQIKNGIRPEQIAYAMVMDEPGGEPSAKLAKDEASIEGFRTWIRNKKLQPADLLVNTWDEVKPIAETDRDKFPALHYYTQLYRTVALGNMIALQKKLIHETWKTPIPVNVNFSDGAIYYGNMFGQGVDYFTLLHETDQNAIWSEDWSNLASTYQNATYNVELMRAAARKHGQHMGHYLIAYAGRTGYDVRLKAVSEAARGIKAFKSFAYGPRWATHEGSPWQTATPIWADHAAVVREIGAVEDVLLPAKPRPAEVALLYSSASDAWTHKRNFAFGFERMHTWLALTHAQVPVDVVHESEVADGLLDSYKVCYLSDPNLTRASAAKLRAWVENGGTLILTAGAGQFDEFNRPSSTIDSLLPFKRAPITTLQDYSAAGRFLSTLTPRGEVQANAAQINVLSVGQQLEGVTENQNVQINAKFSSGLPAEVRAKVGRGTVVARGYLPAIDYVRHALVEKNGVEKRAQEIRDNGIPGSEDVKALNASEKSYNPWQYPAAVREHIVSPARDAKIAPPVVSNVPLVDAVYMEAGREVLIPLANYTLQPIANLTLEISVSNPVREVRSVYHGALKYEKVGNNKIRVTLPLDCTDFLSIHPA